MNNRKKGTERERLAAEFLKRHGVCIVAQNYRTACGEIDLIGIKEQTLIFFEVKYRSSDRFGFPQEAVDLRKQKTISLVSVQYLRERKGSLPDFRSVRYDVISIMGNHITWLPAAFTYCGKGWNW